MRDLFSFSGKGRRENNEDYILSRQLLPDCSIHLLADGMGGYQYGEIAAFLACETIAGYMQANPEKYDTVGLLKQSVAMANNAILKKQKELGIKIGTTIAGAFIEGSKAFLFWLGDVRIYHFQQDKVIFQSEDHSFINEMRKHGIVSALDLERYKNIVMRSIKGASFQDELPVIETNFNLGDTLILCSDGMWQNWNINSIFNLSEDELNKIFSKKKSSIDDNYSIIRVS